VLTVKSRHQFCRRCCLFRIACSYIYTSGSKQELSREKKVISKARVLTQEDVDLLKEEEEANKVDESEKAARHTNRGPICPRKMWLCVLMPF
jgi:hypothetical protein